MHARLIVAAWVVGFAVFQISVSARALPQDVGWYLLNAARFTAADLASLDAGRVIARADDGGDKSEVLVTAAVKIRAARDYVANYYREFIAHVDGQVTLGFGKFASPPSLADVRGLALDPSEIEDLKACRLGKCDIRIGGAGLERIGTAIDWNAADYPDRVNAFARQELVNYVAAYQKAGDAALVTYNDRGQPVSLRDEWRGILANSPYFQHYNAALQDYLVGYPAKALPGVNDIIYWINENYGLKPVVSVVHLVQYQPPEYGDRTVVVQKQLYASHYYDGSVAVTTLVSAKEGDRPVTYLLYGNRSRGDLLKGGFGGLKRPLAREQARKAADQTLGTLQTVLEQASR